MSGGYFDYRQFHIDEIAKELEDYIKGKEVDDADITDFMECCEDEEELQYMKKHYRHRPNRYGFSKKTLNEFKKGLAIIKKASIYAQRIDWFMSGDDSEETFHERLKEDLDKLNQEK